MQPLQIFGDWIASTEIENSWLNTKFISVILVDIGKGNCIYAKVGSDFHQVASYTTHKEAKEALNKFIQGQHK